MWVRPRVASEKRRQVRLSENAFAFALMEQSTPGRDPLALVLELMDSLVETLPLTRRERVRGTIAASLYVCDGKLPVPGNLASGSDPGCAAPYVRHYGRDLPQKPRVAKRSMARMPHLVRNNGARGDLRNPRCRHRCVAVNEWPREGISLSPAGIDSPSCLDPIPGRSRRLRAGQRHDGAIPQHTA
jgi:hypothetical protein